MFVLFLVWPFLFQWNKLRVCNSSHLCYKEKVLEGLLLDLFILVTIGAESEILMRISLAIIGLPFPLTFCWFIPIDIYISKVMWFNCSSMVAHCSSFTLTFSILQYGCWIHGIYCHYDWPYRTFQDNFWTC